MNFIVAASSLAKTLPLILALVADIPDAPTGSTAFEIEDSCLRVSGGEWKAAFDLSDKKYAAQKAQFDAVKAEIAKIMADKKAAEEDAIAHPPLPTAEQLAAIADAEEGKALEPLLPKVTDGSADPKDKDRVLAWLLKRELKRRGP